MNKPKQKMSDGTLKFFHLISYLKCTDMRKKFLKTQALCTKVTMKQI